jgi:hypothetical protein
LKAAATWDPGGKPVDTIRHPLPAIIQPAEVAAEQRAPNVVPAIIADLGEQAGWRYVKFFATNIRNQHTRRAYARAEGKAITLHVGLLCI